MKVSLSLQQTWTALILFAIIIPAAVVISWYSYSLYNHDLNYSLAIEQKENESIRDHIEVEVERYLTLLKHKTDPLNFLLDRHGNAKNTEGINEILSLIITREAAVTGVMLLSNKGKIISAIDTDIDIDFTGNEKLSSEKKAITIKHWKLENISESPEFIIPSLNRTYISSPRRHLNKIDNEIVFNIALPVSKPVKAILIVEFTVDKLWDKETKKEHGVDRDKTRHYILDRRGVLISSIRGSKYKPGDLMTHLAITRAALNQDTWSSRTSYTGTINQPVFGTLTTIPTLHWTLITEVIASNIIVPISEQIIKFILITLFGIMLFIWFVLFLAKRTISSIEKISEAINNVAKGDFYPNIEKSGIRELDAMAEDFQHMTNARMNAEIKLKEREQDLAVTLNSIGDAVIATDIKGNVTRMNSVAENITGWPIGEAEGKSLKLIFTIINASTREPIANPVDKVLTTGETVYLSNHTTLISRDGTEYQISDSAAPIRNGGNNILGMVLVFNDVTEEYKLREAIRSSTQHLNLYRDQTPLAAIEWNVDFQVTNWNNAAEKMFGFTLEEVKGRDFVDIMLPESAMVDVKKIWKDLVAETGGTKSINENLRKDGSLILCEWHNAPLIDESGTVIGAASLVLDITAQHKAQQALKSKEKEQREILNNIVDAVISIDEEGCILSFNLAAEQMFGYQLNEVIGQNVNILMPEPFTTEHDKYLQNYVETGIKRIIGTGRDVEGKHKSNNTFPMRLLVAELPRDSGGKRRFIGSCVDLTYINQQAEQLRRSQKMDALGNLTGGIAHDYNNLLGIIMGYAELLKTELKGQPELADYVSEIHNAGVRGSKLTNKLLSFTKTGTSEATKININDLLLAEKDMLQKTLTVRITLHMDLSEDIQPIWIDKNDLEDAILNMCINAMHAMGNNKSNTELTISTYNQILTEKEAFSLDLTPDEYICLKLIDTGCGMEQATIEKIFDPFFSTKGNEGTGLGLSQVNSFVKRAKGAISIKSVPEQGSEFTLYFPPYQPDEDHNKIEARNSYDNIGGTEAILVVDDEPALLNLTCEILNKNGYEVHRAESAKQGLEILKSKSVDLLLSDVIMPEMDGYAFASIVQEEYPNVKIQMVSGFSTGEDITEGDNVLSQNLLQKPYSAQNLLEKIRALLIS